MFKLKITDFFESAHHLEGYNDKCKNIHGHNWKIEVTFKAKKANEIGIVRDFGELRAHLKKVTDPLDHRYLNDLEELKGMNPTAENLSCYIYQELEKQLEDQEDIFVEEVSVWETDKCCATYCESS